MDSATRTLIVRRSSPFYARWRALRVFVDDELVARLRHGKTERIEVPKESRRIWGRMDWARTEALDLAQVHDGQVIVFESRWLPFTRGSVSPGAALSGSLPFDIHVEPRSEFEQGRLELSEPSALAGI